MLFNTLVVAAYLPIVASGADLHNLPFTDWSFDANCFTRCLFGIATIAIGETLLIYLFGYPLARYLRRMLGSGPTREWSECTKK